MPLNKDQFFDKYALDDGALDALAIAWTELEAIHDHYVQKRADHELIGSTIVSRLTGNDLVHSLRFRVKDAEHLLEKIVRKRREDPSRVITLENYESEITDLVGIRVLHLFKAGWRGIHELLLKIWEPVEGIRPTAYVRLGDDDSIFKDMGCEIRIHPRGYRSVHYIVKCQPTKSLGVAEIQVRTIFEEGWSEIDHRVAYPRSDADPILSEYLGIFNLFAGAADQMGSFIAQLGDSLASERERHARQKKEMDGAITRLEELEGKLKLEQGEKIRLEAIVAALRKSETNLSASTTTTSSPGALSAGYRNFINAQPSSEHDIPQHATYVPYTTPTGGLTISGTTKACPRCQHPLPQLAFYITGSIYRCPFCHQAVTA